MWSVEDNAKLLADFGLSLNEAKVFVTVARLGVSSAGEIAKIAKVRREEVYRVLPVLEKMGLIEKTLDKPFRIKAIPLGEAFQLLLKRRQEETAQKMASLMGNVTKLMENIKAHDKIVRETPAFKPAQFALASGRQVLLNRFAGLVAKSQKQLDIATPRENLESFLYVSAYPLTKAVKKGVSVRIITDKPISEDNPIKISLKNRLSKMQGVDIRYVSNLPADYIISDAEEALVVTSADKDSDNPFLWIGDKTMVKLLQRNFSDMWFLASVPKTKVEF